MRSTRCKKMVGFSGYKWVVLIVFTVMGLFLGVFSGWATQNSFPLQDGDTWVMAGDSITAQHLHTNYFEAFCYARFPKWRVHFRNSGVGGDTIPRVLTRFDWDVEAWKPTVVSVELGMNDSGAGPDSTPAYITNINTLVDRIHKAGARPIFFTASPVNDGTTTTNLKGRNLTLDRYATALVESTKKQDIPCADQFHTLLDLWGKNKPIENMFRLSGNVKSVTSNTDVPGQELLEQWLTVWNKSEVAKQGIDLGGDSVHPGPAGQMMMCAALLKELNAPGLVSKATIDFAGKVIAETQCRVTDLTLEKDGISFDRLDESLPIPIPADGRSALVILPSIEDLSQWVLTIKNIKTGNYEVSIDGVMVATVSSVELSKGWNMGLLETGPVADQCRQILTLVAVKEGFVSQWRAQSASVAKTPDETGRLALQQVLKMVLDADEKIRGVAQPKVHHFVLRKTTL